MKCSSCFRPAHSATSASKCLANSFGSHFPMPPLQSNKLKHLDEPRGKKPARDVLTSFQIVCALKITVHATFLCTKPPVSSQLGLLVQGPTVLFLHSVPIVSQGLNLSYCQYIVFELQNCSYMSLPLVNLQQRVKIPVRKNCLGYREMLPTTVTGKHYSSLLPQK